MCIIHIEVQSIIHMTFEFHVFAVFALMKAARGQNKLFQNASLLMCCCSFAIGQFLTLKNKSEKRAIELLFKVQIRPYHPSSNRNKSCVFTHIPLFVNLTELSMEFPIRICLLFFFQTDGNFYQIILSHTQGRSPNKSLIKKIKCHLR